MRILVRIIVPILLVVPVVYFVAIATEASHRLVNQQYRTSDCRTPAHAGLRYEPINYDGTSDEALLTEADPWECVGRASAAGDELRAGDGVRLAGWYLPSADPAVGPSGPTVVLAHGWTGNKSGQLEEAALFRQTMNVVLFDFRNHGQSGAAATTQGIHEQRDLHAVIDWVVEHKGPETIVLWGQSMGGHVAVNVAADDPRVDAVILDATHPRLTIPMANRIEEDYPFGQIAAIATVAGAWLRTGVNVIGDDPIDAIDDLGDRPVLVIAAGKDETIPVHEIEAMYRHAIAAGVSARIEVCPEAEHHESIDVCPEAYATWTSDFLATVLER